MRRLLKSQVGSLGALAFTDLANVFPILIHSPRGNGSFPAAVAGLVGRHGALLFQGLAIVAVRVAASFGVSLAGSVSCECTRAEFALVSVEGTGRLLLLHRRRN